MAFKNNCLGMVSYCNAFSVWCYKTNERSEEVLGDGYFNDALVIINTGDIIISNCADGTAIRVVNINSDKTVSLIKPI